MVGLSMPFTQFVEVGRVALVCFGPLADKLAVIVDIVDDKRIMIDVLNGDEPRQVISVKRIKLTDFSVKFEKGATVEAVAAAVKAEGVVAKFAETNWGKKLQAQKNKVAMNDFTRFKHQKKAAMREELIKAELAKH